MILGLIRRSYEYMDKDSFCSLFKALVRPHLEFANVVWSPRYVKDKNLIENVLRRASKMVPGLVDVSYEQRLRLLGLPSMSYRRARGDMIEAYKYTHGLYSVNKTLLEVDNRNQTRGHRFKLKKKHSRTALRQHYLSNRITNNWNSLPAHVTEAPTLNTFKSRLDSYWVKYQTKSHEQFPI